MYKDIVFEKIRDIRLTLEVKAILATLYPSITIEEKMKFENAMGEYEGQVYLPFRDKLFDLYVYCLRSTNEQGMTMEEYLLNGNVLDAQNKCLFTLDKYKGNSKITD